MAKSLHTPPINSAAVDETRELEATRSERRAHGRHTQHDVDVAPHTRYEELLNAVATVGNAGLGGGVNWKNYEKTKGIESGYKNTPI